MWYLQNRHGEHVGAHCNVPLHVILASSVTDEEFAEFLGPWLGARIIANPV